MIEYSDKKDKKVKTKNIVIVHGYYTRSDSSYLSVRANIILPSYYLSSLLVFYISELIICSAYCLILV